MFFNEEGTDDAVADTAGAAGTTVGTADALGVLAHAVVFSGAKGGDLQERASEDEESDVIKRE